MEEMKLQVFPVLRSAYGGLTKSERRIADYIVDHPGEVMEETVADLPFMRRVRKSPFPGFARNWAAAG